ncbi:winged helix-turn-helix transcriptional regulator [Patescibacteria group bacterium AH-259-L05]|nr:winged helix-turn-helix transcriptional regulator [Patescibacteria group bacterium AH-259-L05]
MNKQKLHPNQCAILNLLKQNHETLSLRDMADEIGLSSPNTVLHHIRQLEDKGYLRRNPLDPQDFTILKDPIEDITYVNLYGMAQCGPNGLLAEQNVIDRIPLSTKTFGVSDQVFLVKARGDSMEPYIYDKDLVLAAKHDGIILSGSIYVVVHNEEGKIKRIVKASNTIFLESLNPKYPREEIRKDHDFHVAGSVKNIIHFTQ